MSKHACIYIHIDTYRRNKYIYRIYRNAYTHTEHAYICIYTYIHINIHIGISIRFVGMHGCIYIYRIRRHATYVTIPMQIRIYFLSGHNNQEPGCDCFSFFLIPVERLTP